MTVDEVDVVTLLVPLSLDQEIPSVIKCKIDIYGGFLTFVFHGEFFPISFLVHDRLTKVCGENFQPDGVKKYTKSLKRTAKNNYLKGRDI